MIGLVIVAHQPLASALAASGAHVYTCAPERAGTAVRALDVAPGAELDATLAQARALVAAVDDGHGVLVLTDAFGATPGNVATRLAEAGRVAVIAGVNLPMLLRALCYRDGTLAETVDKALAGGTQGIVQVAARAMQNQSVRAQGHGDARLHHQQ
ncbi:MAG: PTS sugar transporter subunit IIA [Betaproteobacteria bacterium]